MKNCGTFRRDHGFSSFIDNQRAPHHAFGTIAIKGCDLGCQRANHSRAIRGAAVPCGESLGVFSEDGGFRWCTTAAHNQARRLAWLAGSFGNSRRATLARRQKIAALARWKYRRKKGSSRIRPIFARPQRKMVDRAGNGRNPARRYLMFDLTLPDYRLG